MSDAVEQSAAPVAEGQAASRQVTIPAVSTDQHRWQQQPQQQWVQQQLACQQQELLKVATELNCKSSEAKLAHAQTIGQQWQLGQVAQGHQHQLCN